MAFESSQESQDSKPKKTNKIKKIFKRGGGGRGERTSKADPLNTSGLSPRNFYFSKCCGNMGLLVAPKYLIILLLKIISSPVMVVLPGFPIIL